MKIKTTFLLFFSLLFLAGNMMVKAQPTEVWNQVHTWNTDRYYRGVDYNPMNNQLYVGGTEGTYVGNTDGTVVEDNMVRILDATTGNLLKTISPASAMGGDWGYGIRDVEVDDAGGIYGTIGTSNQYNPVQLYYWENEDANPVQLWKDASGTADDFGGSFSVYGDFNTEALIIIPCVNVGYVYYFEVVNGVLGNVNKLVLNGLGAIRTPTVQALGTKITDGFWYNTVELAGPVKFNGSGTIVASVPAGVITGVNQDVKYFTAGANEYLAVSNVGKVQIINITGKLADLSDVTAADLTEIPGTAPFLETVWPHVYGNGQEQAVLGNPDGSYAVYSLSGGNYIKALATDGAPIAANAKLSGSPLVGEIKTVEYTYIDVNADAEATSEIKWYVADDATGTNIAEITANAGQSTYTLGAADAGKFISFTVLPVAATGTLSNVLHLKASTPFGPVLAAMNPPVATDVTLTGIAKVGEALTASYTYSDPDGDLEGNSIYEWFRADDAGGTNTVKLAEGSLTYTAVGDDAGKFIIFSVTPVAASGYLLEGTAATTVTAESVLFPPLPPTVENVSITGREEVAGPLTASYTFVDLNKDLEGASILKWYRADDAEGLINKVEVATDVLNYTLVAADEGKYVIFEVTPVTADAEIGAMGSAVTGLIAAEPAPEAPVASNVTLKGLPEVGAVVYGSYTYSDRTDDPEGATLLKWFTADDAAGTNRVEITGAAGKYAYLVAEENIGKHIIFEVTPVATIGGLLEGTPVAVGTTVATTASSNDGDFERMWIRAKKLEGTPEYIGTGSTERGFAIGTEHIYVASRNGGTKLLVIDKADGSLVGQMNTEGMDVGLFKISDVEVSDDGQILACPLQTNTSTGMFAIYKWENELAAPTKFIEFSSVDALRLGDKFTVIGDVSGDAVIYAAASANNKVLRWVVTGGIVDAGTIITLANTTSIGSTAAAAPFDATATSDFIVDGRGYQAQRFDKDGNYIGAYEGVGLDNNQSNSPNVFYYKGRTLTAFHQKNALSQWNIIVQDITSVPHVTLGTSEILSTANQELGSVHVEVDDSYFHLYMISANEGLGYFRGELELPQFVSAKTNHEGTMLMAEFDMPMKEILLTNAAVWSISAGGTEVSIDTIYSAGTTITFELLTPITEGQVITIGYDGTGTIASVTDMPLAAFVSENVVNITGADVPVATAVSFTGDAVNGSLLTGVYTFTDADGDLEGTSLYQWYEATDAAGANKLKLIGEKGITYTVSSDMIGKFVAFEVTPVSATGGEDYLVGEAVMSEFVAVIGVNVDYNSFDRIVIYPNPVADVLSIDNSSSISNVTLIDITGKLLMNMDNLNNNQIRINMSNFKTGIYYLKITSENGQNKVHSIVKTQ
ncbi:MAG: T9SS type A sorting domain-containing protein [Bacteroidales bacterium]|nr:T9SS type A sorting domain-containing protein [Bacteroidales bacterium]MCF8391147.1 T9SS type A sorting domain-containing protein [Bacteroidales bacterium]